MLVLMPLYGSRFLKEVTEFHSRAIGVEPSCCVWHMICVCLVSSVCRRLCTCMVWPAPCLQPVARARCGSHMHQPGSLHTALFCLFGTAACAGACDGRFVLLIQTKCNRIITDSHILLRLNKILAPSLCWR